MDLAGRTKSTGAARIEPRWPPILTLIGVMLLLHVLPDRVRLLPVWGPYVMGGAVLVPMVMILLTRGRPFWLRVERIVALAYATIAIVICLAILGSMIETLINHASAFDGLHLFASSIAIWATNVLYFSLIYWQIDRGGPESRQNGHWHLPDWRFPQDGDPPDVPPGWKPVFVDYLFLAFSTATAFSPTDASPLSGRAKLLMMVQSTISLLTLAVVASRAINILGG